MSGHLVRRLFCRIRRTKNEAHAGPLFSAYRAALVNFGVLPVEPHPFIQSLAEVGIIVIMFAIGFEEDTGNFLRSVKRSWVLPFSVQ